MPTQRQIRGAVQATQEARTLVSRELDVNTTDKRIAIHDGSTAGGIPHVNYIDAQSNEFTYAVGVGTNAITASMGKAPLAYVAGQEFIIKPANSNTGAVTLNVDSLGAKSIKKTDNSGVLVNLTADDIKINIPFSVIYDGTQFVVQLGGSGGVWENIASIDVSGVTNVDFTGLDASYQSYRFEFVDVRENSGLIRARMSQSGVFNTGANYARTYASVASNSGSVSVGSTTAGTNILMGTNKGIMNGFVDIREISSAFNKSLSFNLYSQGSGVIQQTNGAGIFVNAGAVDGVRFFPDSGTFTSGTIKLIGIRA